MAICRPCLSLPCENPADLATGIDSALYSGQDYSFIVQCPQGCYCPPGLFPQTISILASTIPPVIPPIIEPGEQIILRLQGCQALITRTLPAGSSQDAISQAAQSMQAEWAGQQSLCIAQTTPGVNCNTGTSINVCNDAQSFLCYDGETFNVPAGLYCQTLVTTGLTQTQIDAAVASIKANLNNNAKSNFCPAFGVFCSVVYTPIVGPVGFSTIGLRFINVSSNTIDLTPFVICFLGGVPDPFCVGQGFSPPITTTVGPHTFADFAGLSSPLQLRADVYNNGVRTLARITTPVPISQAIRIDVTLGCGVP